MINMNPPDWRRLFVKLLVYHVSLILGLLSLLYFFPALEPYVPVGGLEDITSSVTFEEVVSTYRDETHKDHVFRGVLRLVNALLMSLAIMLTLATMLPISWVYRATHTPNTKDSTVLETLFALPVVITAVVLIIQNSIALAFGLAGIVAGIQYRNRLTRSVDAAYLFAAIAIGIASGIEAAGVGLMTSMWFCLTIVGLRMFNITGHDNVPEATAQENPADRSEHPIDETE